MTVSILPVAADGHGDCLIVSDDEEVWNKGCDERRRGYAIGRAGDAAMLQISFVCAVAGGCLRVKKFTGVQRQFATCL